MNTKTKKMDIPFVDLKAQYQTIKDEIKDIIDEVIESRAFIQGKYLYQFEKTFCELHHCLYGVGCSNGTNAIYLALKALGIGPGDEVIAPTNTFIATIEGIAQTGAIPKLVDIDGDTYSLDQKKTKELIGPKTRAIIPVHLYGNPVDMPRLMEMAKTYDLFVVEDSAQAHLAKIGDKFLGTIGDAGTFSFYPGKNLGAYGDAGFVITKKEETKLLIRKMLDHGRTSKYEHEFLGHNYRMDGIQAAILNVKARYLPHWTKKRREHASFYDKELQAKKFKIMQSLPTATPVYHLYIVEVANREEVMDHLRKNKISCGIHYPIPLHQQPALKHFGYKKDDFLVAEKSAKRILSLPMYPELTSEQLEYILDKFFEVAKP